MPEPGKYSRIPRMRRPRDVPRPSPSDDEGTFERARWPNECQVLSGRVIHIDSSPKEPELYYKVTGREAQPKPVGKSEGRIVFNYMPLCAADYLKLNTRSDKVRLYGRNGDEYNHIRLQKDSEFWGDFASNEIRERNMIVGREVQRSSDEKKYFNCVSKTRERKCDFCHEKINPDLKRFNEFLQTHGNHKNPVVKQTEEIMAETCWCQNKAKFSRSNEDGSKYLQSAVAENIEVDDLMFESRFESGNLARAVRIAENYYELYLRPDFYTNQNTQWFYFQVKNMKAKCPYRFSIVNITKPDILYKEGMRPLIYSTMNAQLHNIGWQRCGENIAIFRNDDNMIYTRGNHRRQGLIDDSDDARGKHCSITLTFEVEFQHENDTVYFAHSYPYTYSNLQHDLMSIDQSQEKAKICKLGVLCRSLAGNNIYCLTVTANEDQKPKRKKAIVMTARVHPSESPSSWMMKGFIDFITGNSEIADKLRHEFVFKIVPMLNPDGVIVGNTRCSLSGYDLNRQYRTATREAYPSIWYAKAMIKRLIEERGVTFYCDMHAHSGQHNIFMYGCKNLKRRQDQRLLEQVFPLMLHKNASDQFSFEDCEFNVQNNKSGTGRVVVWVLGITNSFTLEASFAGTTLKGPNGTLFSTKDYEKLGMKLGATLMDYYDDGPLKSKYHSTIYNELSSINKRFRREFDETEAYLRHRERIRERNLRHKLKKEGKLEDYLRSKGESQVEYKSEKEPTSIDLILKTYKETKMGVNDGVPKFSVDEEKVEKIVNQIRRKKSLKLEEYREDVEVHDNGSEFRPKLAGKTGLPVFFFKNLVNENRSAFLQPDACKRNRKLV